MAKALGRRYIAFDISDEYVKFSLERLEAGPYLEYLKINPINGGTKNSKLTDFLPES